MRNSLILSLLIIGACTLNQSPLVATDVRITAPVAGMIMSAGYMTLRNNTDQPIAITRVASPQFGSIEIHETRIEAQVSRMVALEELVIPARSTVSLEPGGKHLMLMQPSDRRDTVTLNFYAGADIVLTLDATVEQ